MDHLAQYLHISPPTAYLLPFAPPLFILCHLRFKPVFDVFSKDRGRHMSSDERG